MKYGWLALAGLALAGAAQAGDAGVGDAAGAPPRVVLAIFAHPDDELVVSPALAAEARRGADVRIVYATRGDAGPGVSSLPKGAELAAVRSGEAQCASAALGLDAPLFFDFGDGELWRYARGQSGETDAAMRNLAGAIADAIAAAHPAVIVTWGPDGGYGHADHRMVSDLVTQIVQAMPAAARPQLLYPGIPAGSLPPVPEMQSWAVTDPGLLDVAIAYDKGDLGAAAKATQCHATQFDAPTRAALAPLFDQSIWRGAVHFRRALPDAGEATSPAS